MFLIGESDWSAAEELAGNVVQSVKVTLPDEPRSAAIWRHSLAGHVADPGEWADELAGRFQLPAARITAAVELADNDRLTRPGVTPADSCRRRRCMPRAVQPEPG